jgi:hypothetical protein
MKKSHKVARQNPGEYFTPADSTGSIKREILAAIEKVISGSGDRETKLARAIGEVFKRPSIDPIGQEEVHARLLSIGANIARLLKDTREILAHDLDTSAQARFDRERLERYLSFLASKRDQDRATQNAANAGLNRPIIGASKASKASKPYTSEPRKASQRKVDSEYRLAEIQERQDRAASEASADRGLVAGLVSYVSDIHFARLAPIDQANILSGFYRAARNVNQATADLFRSSLPRRFR